MGVGEETNLIYFIDTGCFFRMVPPQKVEDDKIPTKKVKVGLFNSKMLSFNSDFHFFGRDFAILNT